LQVFLFPRAAVVVAPPPFCRKQAKQRGMKCAGLQSTIPALFIYLQSKTKFDVFFTGIISSRLKKPLSTKLSRQKRELVILHTKK
jgi:hypothetical protein